MGNSALSVFIWSGMNNQQNNGGNYYSHKCFGKVIANNNLEYSAIVNKSRKKRTQANAGMMVVH
jgi:hypothetical protein